MEYKGKERSTALPLDEEVIGQLAMEAEIRGMRTGELVAALILMIVKNDLFRLIRGDAAVSTTFVGHHKGPEGRNHERVRV
jgi:hypothetical protein